MNPIFAATMTYNEELFYNRALASTAEKTVSGKKIMVGGLELADMLMGVVAFGLYFLATGGVGLELPNRLFQCVIAVILFMTVLKSLNRMRRSSRETSRSETTLRRTAKGDLSNSGQDGEEGILNFYEDSFVIESPGIISEYMYEGITNVRETEDYLMIFLGQTAVVPVEKAGIYEGNADILKMFLEKKCKKTVEMVKKA